MSYSSVLSEMIQSAPEESENIDQSIEQIEGIQEDLEEKSAAIREGVTDKASDDLRDYLEGDKLAEIKALHPSSSILGEVYLTIGATYGTIGYGTGNITDWTYFQNTIPATVPIIRYVYTSGDDSQIDDWVSDFDFGNDYITHPVEIGAAYGLDPLIDMYAQGKSTLSGSKSKIESSVSIFQKYLP